MHSPVAIVVTYNRRELLIECLDGLMSQSLPCDVVIVDNASSDRTHEYFKNNEKVEDKRIHYLRLEKNLGGAGGFHHGLKYCMENNWDWFWLMDDDARPDENALRNLFNDSTNVNNVYGSAAVGNGKIARRLCFPAKIVYSENRHGFIEYHDALNDIEEVAWLPFLGFLIHRNVVQQIGFPDRDFFILDDDVEYSERAKLFGHRVFLVKNSLIYHPLQRPTPFGFGGKRIYYRSMSPWKKYFDTRNKIFIAKKYFPALLWTQTLPGIIFRVFCSMLYEKEKIKSLFAYTVGICDGILNKKGNTYFTPST